jgi:hypothetical protein
MGSCFSRNVIEVTIDDRAYYYTNKDLQTIKTMNDILNRMNIYKYMVRRMELVTGEPLFHWSTFRYQPVIITMINGKQKRMDVRPLYGRRK